jgi:4-amino-4-deoxy-L-arabinose transferase-like glycosyltransferase
VLIAIVAFFLAGLISWDVFEQIPHVEDEAAYLFQAQVFALGRLSVPTPPYPSAYWSPFVLDYQGQRFGKYPPGYPLLLSLGVGLGAPWIVNALLGSLSLWLIAQLGREIYSPAAGLMAAGLGLTCPVFLAESSMLLSHATSLFFATLFLWAFARVLRDPAGVSRRYAALAGLGMGYVMITRPFDAVGLGLPLALYGLFRVARGNRTLLRHGLIIAGLVILFSLLLPLYSYLLTGSLVNPYRLLWPYDRPGFGPDIGLEGHTLADGLRYARYNLRTVATGWLGWPGYWNIVFLFVPFLFRPRGRWNYLLLISFGSIVALHVTYWHYGGHDAGFPRYYYTGLPALLLLSARGLEVLAASLSRILAQVAKTSNAGPLLVRPPLYLALTALVLYNGFVFLPEKLNAFRGKTGITAAPLEVAREAGVTDALIFVRNYEHWYDFAVFFSANSPTLDSEIVYAIYHTPEHARSVRGLYPDRQCYVQDRSQLLLCPF